VPGREMRREQLPLRNSVTAAVEEEKRKAEKRRRKWPVVCYTDTATGVSTCLGRVLASLIFIGESHLAPRNPDLRTPGIGTRIVL